MTTLTQDLADFVSQQRTSTKDWQLLPADASSRRYYRQADTPFGPALLMVTEPDAPDFHAYVEIAQHLFRIGFSAPKVLAQDAMRGLALIEDFGDTTYNNLLRAGHNETALYDLAIDTLIALHENSEGCSIDLPAYDMPTLLSEAHLFSDWFAPQLRSANDLAQYKEQADQIWRTALSDIAECRSALVLRDFHIDNLILLSDRTGVAACGLLDFQDGLLGAPAYDVMSLTQDARRDVAPELEAHLLARYFAGRPQIDQDAFRRDYALLAAQRHAKVAGIFLRLYLRDGKPTYLKHVPRVLRLLSAALEDAGLQELAKLNDTWLPSWRAWQPPSL